MIPEEAVATIQALLAQQLRLTRKSAIPLDELVQQVRQRCCDKVFRLYSKIQLLNRQQVDVDRLYVDVYVLEKLSNVSHATIPRLLEGRDIRDNFDRLGLGKREKRSPGLEVATEHARLMVFGKPGSGKSTFLRHLAVACARGEFLADCIPVLFELRFVKDGNEFNLWDVLKREFRLANKAQVEQVLEEAGVLLLLDGLDEIPTQFRQSIQDHILEFAQQYYDHHFILTCRTQTTEYVLPTFEPVEVADFKTEQVDAFADNWFSILAETCNEGAVLKQRFLARLRENQPMAELAVTPVLLSLTCWVFGDLKDLPPKRSDLYEQGVCLLLRQWDEQRGVRRDGGSEVYHRLSPEERQQLLSYIAVRKFEQAENFVLFEESEICGYVAEHLQISVEESRSVLRAIAEQHGLLIERAQGIWSFSHLTFQEYLVAKWFCNRPDWRCLISHILEAYWREVFLLMAESWVVNNLLLEMIYHAQSFISSSARLQSILDWINQNTSEPRDEHKPLARRAGAMYFILDLVTLLFQDQTFAVRDFDRFINLAADLAHLANEDFEQDDTWLISANLANNIDHLQTRSLPPNLWNRLTYKILRDRLDYEKNPGVKNWIMDNSHFTTLLIHLKQLLQQTPNENQPIEVQLYFAKLIRQALLDSFRINQKIIVGIFNIEQDDLEAYLMISKLIVECLNIAQNFSVLTSQEIEARILKNC